ncbi:MAG: hypothetical protein JO236_13215 [Mycobacterium sp.]|uniref:hypothetical protein n=1 Tax=Mycobacterium sp. TaxID=1785 RepID=UPI001EB70EAF|nr:hypothetical protein [Mycobacterium sp.]MBW0018489.1 hypothetical protein [Mycobacterium sp.]
MVIHDFTSLAEEITVARVFETPRCFDMWDAGDPNGMNSKPMPVPEDARKATEEQREQEDQLEHRNDDPDAPGSHQSHHEIADESTR